MPREHLPRGTGNEDNRVYKGFSFSVNEDKRAKEIAKGYEDKGYSKQRALSIGYAYIRKNRHRKR